MSHLRLGSPAKGKVYPNPIIGLFSMCNASLMTSLGLCIEGIVVQKWEMPWSIQVADESVKLILEGVCDFTSGLAFRWRMDTLTEGITLANIRALLAFNLPGSWWGNHLPCYQDWICAGSCQNRIRDFPPCDQHLFDWIRHLLFSV